MKNIHKAILENYIMFINVFWLYELDIFFLKVLGKLKDY